MENDGKFNEKSHRINKIRDYFCDGNNKIFAERLNISTTQASNLCSGKINIGEKSLYKILLAFPEVSKEWLFRGEGQMLSTSTPASGVTAKAGWSEGEPTLLQLYTEAIRENERLRMEVERLREKIACLSAETSEVVTSPSDTI